MVKSKATNKIVSLVLSFVILFSITAGFDFSSYAKISGGYDYTLLDDGTVDIYKYRGSEAELIIPSTIDGYTVTGISSDAFRDCTKLTTVTIPDSVISIGDAAFRDCASLTTVAIPDGVKYIGDFVFYGCTNLISITIPNGVTKIGEYAFDGCENLTSVTVPDSVTKIGEYAFDGCENLTSIVIPNGVKCIPDSVFAYCAKLTSVTIPDGVTNIGKYAFACCHSLMSITIPDSVTKIGENAFWYCESLTSSIVIPDGVKCIPDSAFYGCQSLESIVIPDSVTDISDEAFRDCAKLTSVTIPDGVTNIGESAFEGCDSLTSIIIPNSVASIGYSAFGRCEKLTSIIVNSNNGYYSSKDGVLFNKDKTQLIIYPIGNIRESYTIPSNTKSIECYAFYCCENLRSVTIPSSVKSIGKWAFVCCDNLIDVYYGGTAKEWQGVSVEYNSSLTSAEIHFIDDVHTHLYTAKTVQPTCISNGYITHTCDCGDSYTETISALGHTLVKDTATLPTCTSAGLTAGSHCSACGEIISAQDIIVPTGHSYDSVDVQVTNVATCTSTGIKTYTCSVCGETETQTIPKTAHTYKTTIAKATMNKNGSVVTKCTVCGDVKSKSVIHYPKIITLSATSYTYDGKVKKPSVIVKDSNGKKIASSNYTVSYSSGRKNVGKYTVTIKFKGNYNGTVKKTFTIKPKTTTISKVTAGKKAFTVKWKKQSTQTTGYQIQYSTSSNFKNAKTVTVSKNSTTSKTVSKLTGKKKYFVRIRTYKTVKANGKNTKIYSSWSKAKTVKTK